MHYPMMMKSWWWGGVVVVGCPANGRIPSPCLRAGAGSTAVDCDVVLLRTIRACLQTHKLLRPPPNESSHTVLRCQRRRGPVREVVRGSYRWQTMNLERAVAGQEVVATFKGDEGPSPPEHASKLSNLRSSLHSCGLRTVRGARARTLILYPFAIICCLVGVGQCLRVLAGHIRLIGYLFFD
jgi:hypothetical protein